MYIIIQCQYWMVRKTWSVIGMLTVLIYNSRLKVDLW